jgi:hypothetical protein
MDIKIVDVNGPGSNDELERQHESRFFAIIFFTIHK